MIVLDMYVYFPDELASQSAVSMLTVSMMCVTQPMRQSLQERHCHVSDPAHPSASIVFPIQSPLIHTDTTLPPSPSNTSLSHPATISLAHTPHHSRSTTHLITPLLPVFISSPPTMRHRLRIAPLVGLAVLDHLPGALGALEDAAVSAVVLGREALDLAFFAGLDVEGAG
jgi:hypothetical protein